MAHKRGLDGTYLQPTREECFAEFLKAIPQLTISNEERIRLENEKLKEEKSENELLKAKLDNFEEELEKVKQWREVSIKYQKT